MAFYGIAKSVFPKRTIPMGIDFSEIGDVYFVTADTVTNIFQGMLAC